MCTFFLNSYPGGKQAAVGKSLYYALTIIFSITTSIVLTSSKMDLKDETVTLFISLFTERTIAFNLMVEVSSSFADFLT